MTAAPALHVVPDAQPRDCSHDGGWNGISGITAYQAAVLDVLENAAAHKTHPSSAITEHVAATTGALLAALYIDSLAALNAYEAWADADEARGRCGCDGSDGTCPSRGQLEQLELELLAAIGSVPA